MFRLRTLAALVCLALASPVILAPRPATAFEWSGKLATVARGLKDSDPQIRLTAVRALAAYDIKDTKKYLLPMLEDKDANVRGEAANALGVGKVEEAIPVVAQWLQDINKQTRVKAADVLGLIGSQKAVQPLSRALADTEGDVRRAAVEALGKIGGESVVVPIIGRLEDDQVAVRRAAVEKLKDLGDSRAVIPLLERFGDSSKDVRITAIQAVGRLGDQSAAPALIRLLRDQMLEIRLAAVEALGLLKAPAAVDALIPLLDRTSDEMGAKVAEALGRIGDPRAVRELVKKLRTENLRLAAGEALKLVGAGAVPALLECLAGKMEDCEAGPVVDLLKVLGDKRATADLVAELSRTRVKKQRVIEALGAIGDPAALVPLLALLDDKDAELRKQVLKVIEPMLDGRAGDVLIKALADGDEEIRVLAADYLGVLGSKAAVPRLLALVGEDTGAGLRVQAIRSLGRIGDARATKALVALVKTGKADMQLEAADALANLKDPASIAPLLALVEDTAFAARRQAITALRGPLRAHKDDKARKLLEQLTADQDTVLAIDAVDALAAMADPASLPLLLKLAGGNARDLRRAAMEVVGNFVGHDAKAIAVLVKALGDDDDAVRAGAAWSLGKIGDASTIPNLIKATRDQGFATQVNATAALARFGGAKARDELLGLTAHRNPYVRANAAIGLGVLGGDLARKALLGMAKDSHRYARVATVRALGAPKLSSAAGVADVLKELAEKDTEKSVRVAAAEALAPTGEAEADDEWVHIWWTTDEGGPLRQELYVIIAPDGLVKSGYTDVRGEAGEEQFPRGAWEYQCLGIAGPDAYTRLDECRPSGE